MDRKKSLRQRLILLSVAFFLPLGILLLVLAGNGIAPFGSKSLLFLDSQIQYLQFLSYFRTILSGENNLFYSFAKGLGGNFFSLAGYYLLSPFNLLFLAASDTSIALGFNLVVLLKLACCSVCFCFASAEIYGERRILPVFSTAYALSAYNVVYCWNIMWLDGVIFLPLVGLGVYLLWTEGRVLPYFFSLLISLLISYYTGFMLCVASVLFTIAMMLWTQDGTRGLRKTISVLERWLLYSIAAGFLAAVIWLPAIYPVLTRRALDAGGPEPLLLFPIWDLFSKFVPGAIDYNEIYGGLPNIFCTCTALFLAVCYFADRSQPRRKKLVAAGCLLFLLLSFTLRDLNHLWHGFSQNNGFNYRYSFVFSFVLLMIAQHAFLCGAFCRRQILAALLIGGGMLLYVWIRKSDYEYLSPYSLPFALAGLLLCAAVLLAFCKKPSSRLSALLAAVILLEAGGGACVTLYEMLGRIPFSLKLIDFYDRTNAVAEAVSAVREADAGLYRMELFSSAYNDPLFFNYNGISHFSSVDNRDAIRFVKEMGFQQNGLWTLYHRGSTAEAESFLGMKYLLTPQEISLQQQGVKLAETDSLNIYRNPNALPLALFADPSLLRLSAEEDDLFDFHNRIWSAVAFRDLSILREEPNWQLRTENLTSTVDEEGYTVYTRIDPARDASVSFEITAAEALPLYYYFSAPEVQMATLSVNGENHGQYFWIYQWDMGFAGIFEPGEPIQIELHLMQDELCIGTPQFAYEDLVLLSDVSAAVRERGPSVVRESSSHLSGSYSAGEDTLLLFTIPYEEGWELRVDGEKTELIPAMDALLAAQVPAGEHRYSLRFVPPGLYPGMALSAAGAVLLLTSYVVQKRKRAQKEKKMSAHPADS